MLDDKRRISSISGSSTNDPARVLALVPARGGSKGIPRKNVRPFAGHPLIAYSIAAGQQATSVGRVIVSTDDEEIRDVALRYGAEAPFLRPAGLARDDTPDLPVFDHALRWLEEREGYRPELVVQLRPTTPLRPPGCVDQAVELLHKDTAADSLRAVVHAEQTPYKMWCIVEGRMHPLLTDEFDEPYNLPRQSLPDVYWQPGHIDVIRRQTILEHGSMTGRVIRPIFVDARLAVDIDTIEQWDMAEWVLRHRDVQVVRPTVRVDLGRYRLVVFDFDGVLTDNRVHVLEDGREAVACDRSDGHGIAALRRAGIKITVLSTEINPVVSARCQKLGIPYRQGLADKAAALRVLLEDMDLEPGRVVYVGNDVNDRGCMRLAGLAVAVADAHPDAKREAHWILTKPGGRGAVRELCDQLLTGRAR